MFGAVNSSRNVGSKGVNHFLKKHAENIAGEKSNTLMLIWSWCKNITLCCMRYNGRLIMDLNGVSEEISDQDFSSATEEEIRSRMAWQPSEEVKAIV